MQRKLKLLDGAARIDDLAIPAGNRLERLKGQRGEPRRIRVNDRYRVTFRWESGHAFEVCVQDYHEGAGLARSRDSARRDPAGGVPEAPRIGAGPGR
ncbi:MAG: type II toxin-antitoxin system RelE/ParE family toxin [Acidobacteriota bacterium]|nr:type II toxin-antitoxin system RelE/ParE family toxin [Acidobacteriota bacterium]